MTLYTIGHSNHSIEHFTGLLKKHKINLLFDVRSVPYSRYNPQYNKENLQREIIKNDIEYVFMGDKLGGKPRNLFICRENMDFNLILELLRQSETFKSGIYELIGMLDNNKRLSIMCAEENPFNCHRYHLICCYIIKNYPQTEILHIRRNAEIEKNSDIIESMNVSISKKKKLRSSNNNQLSLFG